MGSLVLEMKMFLSGVYCRMVLFVEIRHLLNVGRGIDAHRILYGLLVWETRLSLIGCSHCEYERLLTPL